MGREVRTVVVDPERGPLVRMAFELYATGTYGFHALIQALTDAGLRTRPTRRYPARPISINSLGNLLRNRYYLGYVTHNGQEHAGRHQPLVTPELFERVQHMLQAHRAGGTRERNHNHYLPIARVETAVLDAYVTIALPAELRARIAASADPRELYERAGKRARRVLNQAFFRRLYLDAGDDGPYVASDELAAVIAPIVEVARRPGPGEPDNDNGATHTGDAVTHMDLLRPALCGAGWSKDGMVEMAGIEPASCGAEPGLLRAQSAVLFSAPAVTRTSRRRAQPLCDFPPSPVAGLGG